MINTLSLTLQVELASPGTNAPLLSKHFPILVKPVQPAHVLPHVHTPVLSVPEQMFFVWKSFPVSLPHVSSNAPQVHFPSLMPLVWQNGSG